MGQKSIVYISYTNVKEIYVEWKFKCLSCGYKFKAIEPAWLFKKFGDSCWICGSKDIEKKVISKDFKFS